jgi:hypothetical protein
MTLPGGVRAGLLIAAALLLPPAASAQVYKCTGKDGRVQYSQTRPRGAECQENAVRAPAAIGSDVGGLMKYGEEIDKSRAAEAKDREQAQQQQAQRQAACSQARARAAALDRASRVFSVDASGERHYRSAAERDAMDAAARSDVTKFCG